MNTVGWVIVLILVIPMIGVLVWMVLSASLVRIPSGSLGLLMVKGRATETALLPGPHFVPAIRRRMVEIYPSVEMSYRAGAADPAEDTDLDRSGPSLPVTLGDRTTAIIAYTVRFRLIPDRLRDVHERFGPGGVYGIVRDHTNAALSKALRDTGVAVDDFFGAALDKCQQDLHQAVTDELLNDGIEVTGFLLGTPDLGRTGEVIQATLRARHELELEQAEAATRMARALNDTDLSAHLSSSAAAGWRYRETDLWSELLQRSETLQIALRALNPAEAGAAPIQPGSEPGQASPTEQP